MALETCDICGRRFRIWQAVEERLLQAIYGRRPVCKKCALGLHYPKCTKCGEVTTSGLVFNNKPYCPKCTPHA